MPWTFAPDVQGSVQGWLAEAVPSLEAAFKDTAPVGKGPGAGSGRDSIQGEPSADGAEFTALTHMLYQVTGTREHPIDSHGNYPLRNAETGEVFGRHVEHPGTQPNDFLERGVEATFPGLSRQLGDALLANTVVTGGDA